MKFRSISCGHNVAGSSTIIGGAGEGTTWLGDVVRRGNLVPGVEVPFDEATLYFPQGLARLGDDLLLTCEDAVLIARPAGSW